MHFSSENLHDPQRLQALLKALRLPLWTRRDEPLFDLTVDAKVAEPAQVSAAAAPAASASGARAVVAAKQRAKAKAAAPAAPASVVAGATQQSVAPLSEAPKLNFVFVRQAGMLWVADRDDWGLLAAMLPNIVFFVRGKAESQQALKPTYLEWPLPDIKSDQSEPYAIEALTGKITTSIEPGDQLLLLGEEVNKWLAKCPKVYSGHEHLQLPGAKTLSVTAAAKRKLWLHLSQLQEPNQTS